jgi:hypothetical protein
MENYLGHIGNLFFDVLSRKDGFSAGEKFTAIEKITKKRFFNLTDQEIYQAMETYVAMPIEEDEPMTKVEFEGWVEGAVVKINNKPVGIGRFYENK